MSEKRESNVFYINHKGELLIWLIILLVPVIFFFFHSIFSTDDENEHKIFMPDVDGLIVGSPVRAMGIEIGHVTKIQPVKDEVFVKFIITDKSITLPQGTAATVEFNGMGGSKSLELYLPDSDTYIDSTVPTLTVHTPRRLSTATGLLDEMFRTIGNIITVTSQFGHKLSQIDFPNGGRVVRDSSDFMQYADEVIDIQQKRVDDFGEKLDEIGRKLNVGKNKQ